MKDYFKNKDNIQIFLGIATTIAAIAMVIVSGISASIYYRQADIAETQADISARQVAISEMIYRPIITIQQDTYNYSGNSSLSTITYDFIDTEQPYNKAKVELFSFIYIFGSYQKDGVVYYTSVKLPIDDYYVMAVHELGNPNDVVAHLDPFSNDIKLTNLKNELHNEHNTSGDLIFISELTIAKIEYESSIGIKFTDYWYMSYAESWDNNNFYLTNEGTAGTLISQHEEYPYNPFYLVEKQTIIDYWNSSHY